ncbi:MAG: class I SAM-dependent methyltransferase [Vicinamibacterales bacterium]
MITVATCAVCGSNDLRSYAESPRDAGMLHFAQARCGGCGLLIAQPRATSDEIARYYEQDYYRTHWPDAATLTADNQRVYRTNEYPIMQGLWADWPPRAGSLAVEIGCGYGAFLPMLAADGFRVAGCDLSHDAVAWCRGRRLDVVQGGVPGVRFAEPAGLVVSQHVIEHVEDPRAFVAALTTLAAPGGVIVIVTEDNWHAQYGWSRLLARLRGRTPPFHTSSDHTFVFAAAHLRRLMTEAGCTEVRTRSFCYRPERESLHWRLYKGAMRAADRLLGRGPFLIAVGRIPG